MAYKPSTQTQIIMTASDTFPEMNEAMQLIVSEVMENTQIAHKTVAIAANIRAYFENMLNSETMHSLLHTLLVDALNKVDWIVIAENFKEIF